MSGHETIRVLEVGVDAQLPVEEDGKGLENVAAENSHGRGPAEASEPAGEAGPGNPDPSAESAGMSPSLRSGSTPLGPSCGKLTPWSQGPDDIRILSSCPLDSLWPWAVLLASRDTLHSFA